MNLPAIHRMFFVEGRNQFTHAQESSPYWVMIGLSSGHFQYSIETSQIHECRPGDLMIVPPGQLIKRHLLSKSSFYAIYFKWRPSDVLPASNGRYTPLDVPRYLSTLNHWKRIWNQPLQQRPMARCNSLLYDLLQQLHYEALETQKTTLDRQVFQIAELIQNEKTSPNNLSDLATGVGISPSQLSRRFYAALGVTPATYRTQQKLQKACRYMLNTDWSLDQISEACGFANAFYFSRVFSKHMQCSPSIWRKTHSL